MLIFAVVYIGSQVVLKQFFPQQFGGQPPVTGVVLRLQPASLSHGNNTAIVIENHTNQILTLPDRCPLPPVKVSLMSSSAEVLTVPQPTAAGLAMPCEPLREVAAGQNATYSLAPWKYSLFDTPGEYRLTLPVAVAGSGGTVRQGSGTTVGSGAVVAAQEPTATLRVTEPGPFTKLFRALITKPFLNFLIFAASWLPGHSLGLAIILLTVLVKLILFIPTQKALQGQKEMQILQPKVEALKRKYKDNPVKLNEETMKLWKEHKVNPLQSCLPTLIQFPVLIGLFYTIRDGSTLALSRHLIYPFYQHLTWTFGTGFLGLDLLKPNIWVLPIALVLLQFLQMKLTFAINDRKKNQSDVIDIPSPKELQKEIQDAPKDPVSAQKLQQQMMLYALPLMIGFFALGMPAAVAIYWGVSTLFGIGQQLVVNRKKSY